jgi:nucleotide-binding universal stress UspA family protein
VPWAAIALPEIKLATQNLLKAVFRKAVQVDVSGIGGASGFNLTSKSSRRLKVESNVGFPYKSEKIKTLKPIKILVPTDFSRNADEALRFAVPLARQLGVKITLLHAIDWNVNSALLSAPGVVDAMNKNAEDAAHRLEKLAVPPDLLEKTIVRFAPPHVGIPEAARELDMDLIVISAQGRTGLARVLLGSTAARVVRHASCPVLTVRPVAGAKAPGSKATGLGPVIKRILVPVVFSKECESAIRFATSLARTTGARLTLLHVVAALPRNYTKYIAEIQEYDAEVKLDAKQKLEALAATVPPDVPTQVLLRQGTPHSGIINAARQHRSDLIVLPTRSLKGLKYYLLGSTAEKVVRYALCPVLTFNRNSIAGKKARSKKPSNRLSEDHAASS